MATYDLIDFQDSMTGVEHGIRGGAGIERAVAGFGLTNAPVLSGKQGADPYVYVVVNGIPGQFIESEILSNPSTGWIFFVGYFYFEDFSTNASTYTFCRAGSANAYSHWLLTHKNDGTLGLKNANGFVLATVANAIETKKWYQLVVAWEFSQFGDIHVWWTEEGAAGVKVFTETSVDLQNAAGTDVQFVHLNTSTGLQSTPNYCVNCGILTTDGAAWDTLLIGDLPYATNHGNPANDATLGAWTTKTYRGLKATVPGTPDTPSPDADFLVAGSEWRFAEEIPPDDSSSTHWARYLHLSSDPDYSGAIYTDDPTFGGPSGDSDLDAVVLIGAKWVCDYSNETHIDGKRPKHRFHYGKREGSTNTFTTTDAATSPAFVSIRFVEGGDSDVRVPSKTGVFVWGMKTAKALKGAVTGSIYTSEVGCSVFCAEAPPSAGITVPRRRIEGH